MRGRLRGRGRGVVNVHPRTDLAATLLEDGERVRGVALGWLVADGLSLRLLEQPMIHLTAESQTAWRDTSRRLCYGKNAKNAKKYIARRLDRSCLFSTASISKDQKAEYGVSVSSSQVHNVVFSMSPGDHSSAASKVWLSPFGCTSYSGQLSCT
jgi:hypothetical protein